MGLFRNPMILHRWGNSRIGKVLVCRKILGGIKRLIFPSSDIPFSTKIGKGTFFPHRAIGVIIHSQATIGIECKIESGVVIGGRNGRGAPTIGNYCFIGANAAIIGDVTVGDNVMIGAGAVVISDIEANSIVVGIPAKAIKKVPDQLIGKYKD